MITVSIKVNGSLEKVWNHFTNPEHIVHWNFDSDDWHSSWVKNDLCVNGKFVTRMATLLFEKILIRNPKILMKANNMDGNVF